MTDASPSDHQQTPNHPNYPSPMSDKKKDTRGTHPASRANVAKHNEDRLEARQAKKAMFIEALREQWPNVAEAIKIAGWNRTQAYLERQQDEEYRRAWDEIIDAKMDVAENKLFSAGTNDRGMVSMLIPMLKAYRRHVYGDRLEHSGQIASVSVNLPAGVRVETPVLVGEGGRNTEQPSQDETETSDR